MRLSKYMEYSVKDSNINEFRSCKIHLSKSAINVKKIKSIMEEHALDMSIINKIEKENKKLNILNKGNIFMDFTTDESSKSIDKKIQSRLKIKVLEFNDDLCKIQRKLEEDLRNMGGGKLI